jgi:hypothetical protein
MTTLRHRLGVWLYDVVPYLRAAKSSGPSWVSLHNRSEKIRLSEDGRAARCEWDGSTELHAPRVMPVLGRALMRRAFLDHPVRFSSAPAPPVAGRPRVSFIMGHRGSDRLPLLDAVVASIAGQAGVDVECVVVEETLPGHSPSALPSWVRRVHVALTGAEEGFRRGRNFNLGALAAVGETLVFHDGDTLVPSDYAAAISARITAGCEVVDLKRYVFYLSRAHTADVLGRGHLMARPAEAIVQNLGAGVSIGVSRNAFEEIGGFDDEFEGWGGEDVEFFERAGTRRLDRFGSLPLAHLWHAPQPGKTVHKDTPAMALLRDRKATPPAERILALRARRVR